MLAALLFVIAQTPVSPASQEAEESRVERFLLRVDDLHPLGDRKTILKRLGHGLRIVRQEDPSAGLLDLERASFRTRIHGTYQASRPAGLLVWMDPSDEGVLPETWGTVFDQRNLIAVAPNAAGGNHYAWNRAGLALAAVHGLMERYAIDPNRVYVAGRGSGARMVSRLALGWPDVFQGGLAIGGAAYFEAIPNPERLDGSWPARFKPPSASLLRRAREHSRFVFLAGSMDSKRMLCRLQAMHMLDVAGFRHIAYLEAPRLGADVPSAVWARRAIDTLDGPLASKER